MAIFKFNAISNSILNITAISRIEDGTISEFEASAVLSRRLYDLLVL